MLIFNNRRLKYNKVHHRYNIIDSNSEPRIKFRVKDPFDIIKNYIFWFINIAIDTYYY